MFETQIFEFLNTNYKKYAYKDLIHTLVSKLNHLLTKH
jgi:hypothetical protein